MQSTTSTTFDDLLQPVRPDESRYAHDARLFVEFSREPVMHPGKSREAGRAVYEERDFIRIHVPGDKTSVVFRQVTEQDAQRFADRYAKWKAGQQDAVVGTPLASLPTMTPTKIEEYKYFKIVTVEQLADAPDNLGQKFMSFNADKQRAKDFMAVAANNAPVEAMRNELQKRDAEIENLRTMVEALQAQAKPTKRAVAAEPLAA